ncbi:MAG: hypothetical protein K2M56_00860 [Muribaculaceae bacterium]|nr:hypothetical protein [Muribaculaceae bacterium]
MKKFKSRLAGLLRRWAQRLDPEFKMPPIEVVINRLQRWDVRYDAPNDFLPPSVIQSILYTELRNAILSVGGIKFKKESLPSGIIRHTATMYTMTLFEDEEIDL